MVAKAREQGGVERGDALREGRRAQVRVVVGDHREVLGRVGPHHARVLGIQVEFRHPIFGAIRFRQEPVSGVGNGLPARRCQVTSPGVVLNTPRMPAPQPSLALAALAMLGACQPDLPVGEWRCAPGTDAATLDSTMPVELPWSTGFEDQFCGYAESGGFCYAEPNASYTVVTSPVHSGHFAAAFKVTAGDTSGHQTRCVRQGAFPTAAYYGAWYFVPERATNPGLWNLVHFQGGDPANQHGLWDISLVNDANGQLEVVVFDFLNGMARSPAVPAPIPIGAWFHLELYLERAADATGEIALYQDGELLIHASNLITDDTSWSQWYVGNLATDLSPIESTLYVDDVTIRSAR